MKFIKQLFCKHNFNLSGNPRGDIYKACTKCSKRIPLLIRNVNK